jgi:deazaflavin-dependent oxidoreductase (nitroreductase family)
MTKGIFRRWLYRGRRPNWLARLLNRLTVALAASGFGADSGLATLEVTGRFSGQPVSLPVVVAAVEGQRYLVSMLGENVQWVKNVRAAGGKAVVRSGSREEVHLEEVSSKQCAPILKAYLQRAPGARSHVPVNLNAPLAQFEQIAAAYPVFRVASPRPDGAEPACQGRKAKSA